MSKTGQWIMDLEEKLWDDVSEEIKECATESEAQIYALKLADERGLLGNYIEVEQLEEAVNEMWQEFWAKFN
tara:strand:+ start:491 stop:706 length:216 start_codon:yes stop_codon:yes gene_type:complete